MVSSSKILTVSYGTFSCTLEGFDDSFDTMKAIAEYFRDLARDDRYFGAEPPTPDAEMLARIAEREIARRVEARVQDGAVVLRASGDRAGGQAMTALAAASGFGGTPAAPAAAPAPAPAAAAEAPDAGVPEAPAEAAPLPEVSEDTEAVPMPAAAPQAEPASVAEKLKRIRAVVSTAPAQYTEDEHAELPEPVPAAVAPSADADAGDDDALAGAIAGLMADETVPPVAEAASEDAPDDADEAPATPRVQVLKVKRADFDAAVAGGLLEQVDEDEDDDADAAETVPAAPLAAASTLSDEDEADLARELAELEAELGRDAADAAVAPEAEDEDEDDGAAAWLDDADGDDDEAEDAALARDVRDTFGDEAEDSEDRLAREMSDAFAEDDADGDASFARELEAAFGAAADDDDAETDPRDRAAAGAELDEEEEELAAAARALTEDDDADLDADDAAFEQARRTVKLASPARAMLTETQIEDDEGSVSRIMDRTDSQFQEPEGNRRRSAIAHLRAAVAAARADRLLGRRKSTEEEATPYREDLATVVRPRRPQAAPAATERPAAPRPGPTPRPAPLKLVAEQRVDADETAPVQEAAQAVRPRRVRPEPVAEMPAAQRAGGQGFAEFARAQGATALPDLLEAAAAYMSFVEEMPQFSRPQLMTKLREAEARESSREDRLRSFGQLLREGKIAKLEGGRFTAADRIGFRPKRAAS